MPCHALRGLSPTSHRGGTGSRPGQFMRNLRRKSGIGTDFFFEFGFPSVDIIPP